jgi:hypothetical protein
MKIRKKKKMETYIDDPKVEWGECKCCGRSLPRTKVYFRPVWHKKYLRWICRRCYASKVYRVNRRNRLMPGNRDARKMQRACYYRSNHDYELDRKRGFYHEKRQILG